MLCADDNRGITLDLFLIALLAALGLYFARTLWFANWWPLCANGGLNFLAIGLSLLKACLILAAPLAPPLYYMYVKSTDAESRGLIGRAAWPFVLAALLIELGLIALWALHSLTKTDTSRPFAQHFDETLQTVFLLSAAGIIATATLVVLLTSFRPCVLESMAAKSALSDFAYKHFKLLKSTVIFTPVVLFAHPGLLLIVLLYPNAESEESPAAAVYIVFLALVASLFVVNRLLRDWYAREQIERSCDETAASSVLKPHIRHPSPRQLDSEIRILREEERKNIRAAALAFNAAHKNVDFSTLKREVGSVVLAYDRYFGGHTVHTQEIKVTCNLALWIYLYSQNPQGLRYLAKADFNSESVSKIVDMLPQVCKAAVDETINFFNRELYSRVKSPYNTAARKTATDEHKDIYKGMSSVGRCFPFEAAYSFDYKCAVASAMLDAAHHVAFKVPASEPQKASAHEIQKWYEDRRWRTLKKWNQYLKAVKKDS